MTSNSKEDTRFRVLRLLQETPDITQRQIAEALGISLGGVNYCLSALASKGLVKIRNFRNSNNKMGYAYLLTPKGITEKTALTTRFLKRKIDEYEVLKAEIEALKKETVEMSDLQSLGENSRS
jgi:EPS-associated MarR family transcriptional regulator